MCLLKGRYNIVVVLLTYCQLEKSPTKILYAAICIRLVAVGIIAKVCISKYVVSIQQVCTELSSHYMFLASSPLFEPHMAVKIHP